MKKPTPLRVLFADSLHTFRFYFGNALRARGFSVQVAKNVLDLWGELATRDFDLLVLDALFLDHDSNLLRNLTTHHPHAKIVLFSWAVSQDIAAYRHEGLIIDALQKGEVSPEEMVWRLEGYARTAYAPKASTPTIKSPKLPESNSRNIGTAGKSSLLDPMR